MTEHIGKLRWRCRRGMKELDLLTLAYLERYFPSAPSEEQAAFADLLELPDPLLMGYMLGRDAPLDPAMARVVGIMRSILAGEVTRPDPETGASAHPSGTLPVDPL